MTTTQTCQTSGDLLHEWMLVSPTGFLTSLVNQSWLERFISFVANKLRSFLEGTSEKNEMYESTM